MNNERNKIGSKQSKAKEPEDSPDSKRSRVECESNNDMKVTFLNAKFSDKDEVKELGACWDQTNKKWLVRQVMIIIGMSTFVGGVDPQSQRKRQSYQQSNNKKQCLKPFKNINGVQISNYTLHAWNIDGSSSDKLHGMSWIKFWEISTGKKRNICSYKDCERSASVGGHIWIKKIGVQIAPICSLCNDCDNVERHQDQNGNHSKIRNNTIMIETEQTDAMRNSNRRIRTDKDRQCEICQIDISDRPESHTLCYDCYQDTIDSEGSRQSDSQESDSESQKSESGDYQEEYND